MAGYQSKLGNADAALQLISVHRQYNPVFITQLQKHLIVTSTAAHLRCIIVQFLTGDRNLIAQILSFKTAGS
jgi:hypothetical protein